MIFDIVLLAIILICAYFGYKRGFVRTLCGLGSLLISAVVSLILYDDITEFISNSAVGNFISEKCFNSLANTNIESMPEFLRKATEDTVGQLQNTVAGNMAHLIIAIVSVIVTFVAVRLAIKLLFKVFNVVTKLPVLKQFNHLFGLVFGILNGLFWTVAIVFAVSYISLLPEMAFLKDVAVGSQVLDWILKLGFMPDILIV